jgi:hypothetical protein
MKVSRNASLFLCCALLAACEPAPVPPGTVCAAGAFSVDDDFDGARRGPCRVDGNDRVILDILPEDDNVTNGSPWFAFRVTPTGTGQSEATIVLDYGTWEHRYDPKLSTDGKTWTRLDLEQVSTSTYGHQAELTVPLSGDPVWIAAQELITGADYDEWTANLLATTDATVSELGRSQADRPIPVVTSAVKTVEVVMLIGRQHPPEVSGAYAFLPFAETLLGDSRLAVRFRERYSIVAIPLLNPDGVAAGHWRHGLGGMDINRDWGTFTQPETALVRDLLAELDSDGRRLVAFIDFHSTGRNLFYTFPEGSVHPPAFFKTWFSRAMPRLDYYPFSNENAEPRTQGVGKNYINERYPGVAATYEVGDETERGDAEDAAIIFAEEFMTLLLEQPMQ